MSSQFDVYQGNLGAGFNSPMSILPYGPDSDQCQASSCLSDLNRVCPSELQLQGNKLYCDVQGSMLLLMLLTIRVRFCVTRLIT
ncbi:conserved hypothetical protein [Ricinus communis]|uniref:Uncharacterized protein n=1 Tax=Ricinus communis TaxID=3988 RepID=B9SLM1_RICCO|nr:conserved hypothetical protein [Ricinus communis]